MDVFIQIFKKIYNFNLTSLSAMCKMEYKVKLSSVGFPIHEYMVEGNAENCLVFHQLSKTLKKQFQENKWQGFCVEKVSWDCCQNFWDKAWVLSFRVFALLSSSLLLYSWHFGWCVLRLEIDLVSYPARVEGLVNMYMYLLTGHCLSRMWHKVSF